MSAHNSPPDSMTSGAPRSTNESDRHATERIAAAPTAPPTSTHDEAPGRGDAGGTRDSGAAGRPTTEGGDGIVAFIGRSTGAIWDEHKPGVIAAYYTPTTIVHTPEGDIFGRDAVIERAIQKMAAFPDIKDHITDVIWTQDGENRWRTSMRWTWTATNTGYGIYGPPTGRRVVASGIANCVVHGNSYIEEWVVYDDMTVLAQLGLSVEGHLAGQGQHSPVPEAVGEISRLRGQEFPEPLPARPAGAPFDVEDAVRRYNHDVWNRRIVGDLDRYLHNAVVVHAESGRELKGTGDVKQHVLGLLAMLPDCWRSIDEVYYLEEPPGTFRVAVRWTIIGTHTGPSRYGPPTGRRVRIMGITHQRVQDGLVVEEWLQWSELALIRALGLPVGPDADPPSAAGESSPRAPLDAGLPG